MKHLFRPDSVLAGVSARSRKHTLDILSGLLARASNGRMTATEAFNALASRERLGCTALGHAVAMPHGRVAGLTESLGALVRLAEPVDFDTADGQPVDLVFALLVPEAYDTARDHELSTLARRCADARFRERLRAAESARALHQALTADDDADLLPRTALG